MWAIVITFVLGVATGLILCICGILFVLAQVENKENSNEKNAKKGQESVEKKEENSPEQEEKLLFEVLKFLKGEVGNENDELHPSEEIAPLSTTLQMDKCFSDSSKDAKDRQKHVRSLNTFFADYSKITKIYCKDLAKLSQTAESYVKAQNDKYLDKW